ncbi:MAG: pilus assembly protein TadE [Rhodobacterales bacterium]|nr:MAG: pilus assembly protein TadE [Rhodobacterales bacterium]
MRRLLKHTLRRFAGDEAGNATVEFAILFPLMVTVFLSSIEISINTFRHSMLERGMDMAVRNIRLGTGTPPQHDDIKEMVCNFAGVLPDCENNLRLEMIRVDMRNFVEPRADADCIDNSEEVAPVREFVAGQANEMMFLRACFVFSPVFPGGGLGYYYDKDGAGNAAMVASSAFVQEPN